MYNILCLSIFYTVTSLIYCNSIYTFQCTRVPSVSNTLNGFLLTMLLNIIISYIYIFNNIKILKTLLKGHSSHHLKVVGFLLSSVCETCNVSVPITCEIHPQKVTMTQMTICGVPVGLPYELSVESGK